ncbi:hypothetical protein BKA70DRAFT_1575355 [Coprinopsis sp. MPI-PUGE-AT-0042]|nr:hypothetical protein BKA70DRAFT_1575355 [Coprinopsis sp. MPI-PUGE-AT-0042]
MLGSCRQCPRHVQLPSTPRSTSVSLTEEHWNEAALEIVEEKGAEAGALQIYSASKVLAERDFVKKHKDEIGCDPTTIAPPFVFGPVLGEVTSLETLGGAVKFLFDYRPSHKKNSVVPEKETTRGERILLVAESLVWQDFVDVGVNLNLPGREVLKGFPDLNRRLPFSVDTRKSKEILGLTYRSKEETVKDTSEISLGEGFWS